jgi:glycosyltransferase involved in cell wall biosynthesis
MRAPPNTPPRLSLVIPILNEEEALPSLCARLSEVVTTLGMSAEFLFVDDGSTDRSVDTLRRLQQQDARIRVLVLSRNFGKEAGRSAPAAE